MLQELRQKAWRQVSHTFPERQIYIRSDGRVQFFAFDPMMQAICAGAGALILGWVAFTSVNVIFKDRIIAAKERHFVEMQTAYEARIADLQISYDELNGALATAEDKFESVANEFETKQKALASLIGRKQALEASLGIGAGRSAAQIASAKPVQTAAAKPVYLGVNMGLGGIIDELIPNIARSLTPTPAGIGPLRALPPFTSLPSSPRESTPAAAAATAAASPASLERTTFLDGAVRRIGALFGRKPSVTDADNVALRHIAENENRIARLDDENPVMLSEAKQTVDSEVTRLTKILRNTGIDPKKMTRIAGTEGQGGPLVPLRPSQIETPDQNFNAGVVGTMNSLAALDSVVGSLQSVPLTTPLQDAPITSGFGGRSDPFTENFAYHSGIDFSGPKGIDVRVTAPGVVAFAGRLGDYGNMVEVDHGNGIRTRYGHLMKVDVPVGAKLDKGDVVGELGSTGRSTGPHVHYEVWYDNTVRDPQRFIKAGRDVLKGQ
jgi:murein DD-endopeptidase MepM/ murein hydrolase activator NlpD